MSSADIGVFGGSGFYSFLEGTSTVEVETPYGSPSAPVTIGEVGGRRVAFLPRHGSRHEYPPHRIPYKANLWAMKELGVGRVLGPNACGSLQVGVKPGDFVIGTGVSHAVRDLADFAFQAVGLNPEDHIRIDPELARPAEIEEVVADASKARRVLGWEPKDSCEEVIEMMVEADLEQLAASA